MMHAFFGARPVDHPELGRLVRRGGRWRGDLTIEGFPTLGLSLPGGRGGPELAAVTTAAELRSRWPSLAGTLASELYEHYGPYREAIDIGELSMEGEPFPEITSADDVWLHVTELTAAVHPRAGGGGVLFGLGVAWDPEHTLGATFREWTLTDFSGSIGSFEL